jgi:hypothetical protein
LFDAIDRRKSAVSQWVTLQGEAPRVERISLLICPTRPGKNGEFSELMYDSAYDESYIQDRR